MMTTMNSPCKVVLFFQGTSVHLEAFANGRCAMLLAQAVDAVFAAHSMEASPRSVLAADPSEEEG